MWNFLILLLLLNILEALQAISEEQKNEIVTAHSLSVARNVQSYEFHPSRTAPRPISVPSIGGTATVPLGGVIQPRKTQKIQPVTYRPELAQLSWQEQAIRGVF